MSSYGADYDRRSVPEPTITRVPAIKDGREITVHRDGMVSYWSVYEQVWTRQLSSHIPLREIAAMSESDRSRLPEGAGTCA